MLEQRSVIIRATPPALGGNAAGTLRIVQPRILHGPPRPSAPLHIMPTAHQPCESLGLLVQCRPGFESDAGLELETAARAARLEGKIDTQPNSGFVVLALDTPQPHDAVRRRLDLARLIFCRQACHVVAVLDELPERDRLPWPGLLALANDTSELASVLSHEMAHAVRYTSPKSRSALRVGTSRGRRVRS